MNIFAKSSLSLVGVAFLAGCSSVSLPNVDFKTSPEFQKEAENIGDYPKVSDAPVAPGDVRSDAAWDDAARKLMKVRADFTVPESGQPKRSDAEIEAEMRALEAKVKAYKLDDPQ